MQKLKALSPWLLCLFVISVSAACGALDTEQGKQEKKASRDEPCVCASCECYADGSCTCKNCRCSDGSCSPDGTDTTGSPDKGGGNDGGCDGGSCAPDHSLKGE